MNNLPQLGEHGIQFRFLHEAIKKAAKRYSLWVDDNNFFGGPSYASQWCLFSAKAELMALCALARHHRRQWHWPGMDCYAWEWICGRWV